MTVYSEEVLPIPVGLGIDSYNHPANLADGFCTSIKNFLAKSDRLVTRKGFAPPNAVDTREQYASLGIEHRYTKLPNLSSSNFPVAIWGCGQFLNTWMIRQFQRNDPAGSDGAPGITAFPSISGFRGACVYLDKLYCLSNSGVDSLSNLNWSTGTVTKTNIPILTGSPGNLDGLFVFKDRLWSWDSTKIYYTDPPNSPGGYPEVWDLNGKFIVIGAGSGLGKIFSVIPVGTKLFVFTASGLYNISVLGSPENWVVRLLDATVKVNSFHCAYEDKGLIYFTDTRGVWVTNQDEVKLISEKIQDVFQEKIANTYFEWKLFPFAEGIILCRKKIQASAGNRVITEAKLFYTRLDFIAWAEVTFGTTSQPGDILAGFSNLESHVIWAPTNYLVMAHGNSVAPTYTDLTVQLLAYQGYQDRLTKIGSGEQAVSVKSSYSSKILRGQMLNEKRGKYGYINFSTAGNPGDDTDIDYQWDTEQEVARQSDSINTYDVISAKEGLIKIKGPEYYRHLQFSLSTTLSAAIQEYTVLGSALVEHTQRRTPRVDS